MRQKNILVVFLLLSVLLVTPRFAFADDLALTGSNSFSGAVNVAMPITDLQISGTTPSSTPVKLFVTSGTLAMSTTTGLTFTGPSTGSVLYFSGTLANINAALATLTYTRASAGSDTLEVSLVNQGEVFYSANGHLYKFITSTTTWNSANTAAAGQTAYGATGYLATITSSGENAFISARLSADGWIGASDAAVEGDWKWVTGPETGTSFWSGASGGSPVGGNYSNWNAGEPNDSGGNEDCAEYYSGSSKWNDLPCSGSTLSGYVVEFGATGNMPTVVAKNISITTSTDITPPTVPGTPTTTTPTRSVTPTWTWTPSTDAGSGLQDYWLKWSQNSNCNGGSNTTTGTTPSYTIPSGASQMNEGTWYFCVAAEDMNGNLSAYAPAGSVVVDRTPPMLTQVTQLPVNTRLSSAQYYFSANESGTYNTPLCGGSSQVSIVSGTSVNLINLIPGVTYSCSLTLTDAAGNTSNTLNIGPVSVVSNNGGGLLIYTQNLPQPSAPVQTQTPSSPTVSATTPVVSSNTQVVAQIPSPSASQVFSFKVDMKQGSTISDVKHLQQFFKDKYPEMYPDGNVDGVFGPLTYKAVVQFQEKYFDEILTPIGATKGTGVVAKYTRKKLNSFLGLQ